MNARTLISAALAAAAAVALTLAGTASPAQAADLTATFTPGATWTDTAGNVLQMHGLGIIKVGNTWYGYGEDKAGQSSASDPFQDIACDSSTNLQTWTYQGKALTRQASGDLGPNRVVERPKVIYNSSTHEYVMWMHIDSSNYSAAEAGVAESSTPCGPYTYLGASRPLGFQSRDMGLFQDTNGTAYLLSEDRANGLRIDKLSSNYLSVVSAGSSNGGSAALLADYEAPAMVHVGSTYYLLASHLTGWSANDNIYSTASSPAGPWSSVKNFAPVGTNTYATQTANIIPVSGSAGTTYVYAGDRWTASNLGTAPLIWLPMDILVVTRPEHRHLDRKLEPGPGHRLPHRRQQLPGPGRGRRVHRQRRAGRSVDQRLGHQPAVDPQAAPRERVHAHESQQRTLPGCARRIHR